MYKYTMKYDLVAKDYSVFVNIVKHKDKNSNKQIKERIPENKIATKLLNLKKSDIELTPHCCRHTCVPILADKEVDPTIH